MYWYWYIDILILMYWYCMRQLCWIHSASYWLTKTLFLHDDYMNIFSQNQKVKHSNIPRHFDGVTQSLSMVWVARHMTWASCDRTRSKHVGMLCLPFWFWEIYSFNHYESRIQHYLCHYYFCSCSIIRWLRLVKDPTSNKIF